VQGRQQIPKEAAIEIVQNSETQTYDVGLVCHPMDLGCGITRQNSSDGPVAAREVFTHGFIREFNFSMPSGPEPFSHRQRAQLVGLQGNFLREHHVAGNERLVGHKAPTGFRTPILVKFVNISGCAIAYAESLAALTARDFEISVLIKLSELVSR
jgi:hypothetical protein